MNFSDATGLMFCALLFVFIRKKDGLGRDIEGDYGPWTKKFKNRGNRLIMVYAKAAKLKSRSIREIILTMGLTSIKLGRRWRRGVLF